MEIRTSSQMESLSVFWNPSCGYCRAMLDDVKAWEEERPAGSPDLIVISAGSPAANREQGFRSRVLLDPKFAAGRAFGSSATPSALLVDERGRVASEVVVGAAAVLKMAGASTIARSVPA